MNERTSRRTQISLNRQKLMARWQDETGQDVRLQIMAALQNRKPLPFEAIATLPGRQDTSPSVDLRCINLSGENLDGVDLTEARLQGANLARCSLKKAKLAGADLRDAFLRNADLTDADLCGANLDGACLENTVLRGTDLTGAFITESTIVAGIEDWPPGLSQPKSPSWLVEGPTVLRLRRKRR